MALLFCRDALQLEGQHCLFVIHVIEGRHGFSIHVPKNPEGERQLTSL